MQSRFDLSKGVNSSFEDFDWAPISIYVFQEIIQKKDIRLYCYLFVIE